ncbi:MAG: YraN family protein [Legionella sp.]
MSSKQEGSRAEQKAMDYLCQQGLKFVARNYSCRLGEIDLIMRDKDLLVFIEVRARASARFGGGATSVTASKQQKIIKTTTHYLLQHKLYDKQAVRFDVVSIDGPSATLSWIKDAFN